ncbi:PREDICTED: uncharacterized protein LOC106807336 [Priapulus caudatus]|uniref:Uncharacterized protein LOC106807336 n=1 Tax=Priapulus caudatus TaxID=37621 RepID=A0ABM1DYV7_PRICU|nr:PREDICTED: uncharacterized protein LOC106807336 [Priapulus caudatus]
MASSTDEVCTPVDGGKLCFMCIFPANKSTVVPFSDKTWSRFSQFVNKWKDLEGDQTEIARRMERVANNMKKREQLGASSAIYKRSLQPNPVIPPPDGHGWKMDSSGELVIDWMNLPSAPESVMELANCTASCKRSGCNDVNICSCLENAIPYTDLCKCARMNCSNVGGQHQSAKLTTGCKFSVGPMKLLDEQARCASRKKWSKWSINDISSSLCDDQSEN